MKAVHHIDPLHLFYTLSIAFLFLFLLVPITLLLLQPLTSLSTLPTELPLGLLQYLLKITLNTLMLGAITVAITLALAIPLSLFIVKLKIYGKGVWMALLTIPMITPTFITAFALIILFGNSGIVNILLNKFGFSTPSIFGLFGLVTTNLIHSIPYAVLIIVYGLRTVPGHIDEAGQAMGVSILKIQSSLILPYVLPHIIMAGLIVFLTTIGDIGAPLIIGGSYKVMSYEIYSNFVSILGDNRITVILGIWVIIISFVILFIVNALLGNSAKRLPAGQVPVVYDIPFLNKLGTWLVGSAAILLLLPTFISAVFSFHTVWDYSILPKNFTYKNYMWLIEHPRPLINTLIISVLVMPLLMGSGFFLGHLFRVRKRFRAVSILTIVPFVLPGVVIGVGLLDTYTNFAGTGTLILPYFALLIIAIVIRRLPFVLKTIEAGFASYHINHEEAAINLGAGSLRTLFTITFPQLRPILFSALIIGIIKSATELSVSLVISPPDWQNLPIYITYFVNEDMLSRASALSIVLIVIISIGTSVSSLCFWRNKNEGQIPNTQINWEGLLINSGFVFKKERPKRLQPSVLTRLTQNIKSSIGFIQQRMFLSEEASLIIDERAAILNANQYMLKLLGAKNIYHLRNSTSFYNIFYRNIRVMELFSIRESIEDLSTYILTLNNERIPVVLTAETIMSPDGMRMIIFCTPVSTKRRTFLKNRQLKKNYLETEIRALNSQINPHFIFNTLNSIVELIDISPQEAQETLLNMSDLFRYVLSTTRQYTVSVEEELNIIKLYESIEKARFEDKLKIKYNIDGRVLPYHIPPLLLQPLVENSVNYGNDENGKITIQIDAVLYDDEIVFKISDWGQSIISTQDVLNSQGIGLKNVQNRIAKLYNRKLNFEANYPSGLCVTIQIPTRE